MQQQTQKKSNFTVVAATAAPRQAAAPRLTSAGRALLEKRRAERAAAAAATSTTAATARKSVNDIIAEGQAILRRRQAEAVAAAEAALAAKKKKPPPGGGGGGAPSAPARATQAGRPDITPEQAAALVANLADKTRAAEDAKAGARSLQERLEALQLEVNKRPAEIAAAQAQLAAARDNERRVVASLQAQLLAAEAAKARAEQAQRQTDSARAVAENASADAAKLVDTLTREKADLAAKLASNAVLGAAETQKLKDELTAKDTEIEKQTGLQRAATVEKDRLSRQVDTLKGTIQKHITDANSARTEIAAKTAEIKGLQNDIAAKDKTIAEAKAAKEIEIGLLKAEISSAKEKATTAEAATRAAQKATTDAEAQVLAQTTRANANEAKLLEAEKEGKELQRKLDAELSRTIKNETAIANLRDALKTKADALKEQRDENKRIKGELKQMGSLLKDANAQILSAQKSQKEAEAKAAGLETRLNDVTAAAAATKTELEGKITARDKQLQQAEKDYQASQKSLRDAQTLAEDRRVLLERAGDIVDEAARAVSKLRNEKDALVEELKAKGVVNAELTKQVVAKDKAIATAEAEKLKLSEQVTALTEQKTVADAALKKAAEDLAAQVVKTEAATKLAGERLVEITRIQGKLDTASAQVTQLGKDVAAAKAETATVQGKLDKAISDAKVEAAKITKLEGDLKTASDTIAKNTEELGKQKKQIEDNGREIDGLKDERKRATEDLEKAAATLGIKVPEEGLTITSISKQIAARVEAREIEFSAETQRLAADIASKAAKITELDEKLTAANDLAKSQLSAAQNLARRMGVTDLQLKDAADVTKILAQVEEAQRLKTVEADRLLKEQKDLVTTRDGELKAVNTKLSEANATIVTRDGEIKQLGKDIEAKDKEIKELTAQGVVDAKTIAEKVKELTELTAKKVLVDAELVSEKEKVKGLEKTLETTTASLKTAQSNLKTAVEKHVADKKLIDDGLEREKQAAAKIKDLDKDLGVAKADLTTLRATVAENATEIAAKKKVIEELTEQRSQLITGFEQIAADIGFEEPLTTENIRQALKDRQAKNEALLADEKQKVTGLTTKLTAATTKIAEHEQTIATGTQQLKDLGAKLTEAEKREAVLKAQIISDKTVAQNALTAAAKKLEDAEKFTQETIDAYEDKLTKCEDKFTTVTGISYDDDDNPYLKKAMKILYSSLPDSNGKTHERSLEIRLANINYGVWKFDEANAIVLQNGVDYVVQNGSYVLSDNCKRLLCADVVAQAQQQLQQASQVVQQAQEQAFLAQAQGKEQRIVALNAWAKNARKSDLQWVIKAIQDDADDFYNFIGTSFTSLEASAKATLTQWNAFKKLGTRRVFG